jgi:hypothetical protein
MKSGYRSILSAYHRLHVPNTNLVLKKAGGKAILSLPSVEGDERTSSRTTTIGPALCIFDMSLGHL